MGNLASDQDNTAFVGAVPDTSGLGVRFYKDVRKNDWQSEQQGRPIFEEVTMIHIVLPGNPTFDVVEVVQDRHRARFPLQWASFQNTQNGSDPQMVGTPLEQWPLIGRAQAEELKALKFFTVDSIAQASDATLQRMGMAAGMAPHALRERAQRFLQASAGDALANHQAAELEKLRKEQADKDARHAEQLAKLQAQVEALAAQRVSAPQRKRKYTRKTTAAQAAA